MLQARHGRGAGIARLSDPFLLRQPSIITKASNRRELTRLLWGPARTPTSDQQRRVISGQWMRRGLRPVTREIIKEAVEAFPRFFPEKQQGASRDKHNHFRPAESSQDHHAQSNAVLHSPRARV